MRELYLIDLNTQNNPSVLKERDQVLSIIKFLEQGLFVKDHTADVLLKA